VLTLKYGLRVVWVWLSDCTVGEPFAEVDLERQQRLSLVAEVRDALNHYVRSPEAKRVLQERGD
jgi:hypothetical protein